MDWNRGYQTQQKYSVGFYREIMPNWIDFCALMCGHRSPRENPSSHFNYLELGSGMGFHLCLMAAVHPEGHFVGIDFHPDHILHSINLANSLKLKNIEFIENDFVSLSSNPGCFSDKFDYVVAHGIISWVSQEVQQSLFKLASQAIKLGGLFYSSYNSMPGKLFLAPLQHLSLIEYQLNQNSSQLGLGVHPVHRAADTLKLLMTNEAEGIENGSLLGCSLPFLSRYLATELESLSTTYLSGEFLNENWKALSSYDVIRLANSNKLEYVGSATIPENFASLLPDNIQKAMQSTANLAVKELIKDLGINQGFRRDIFCRGRVHLTFTEQFEQMSQIKFCTLEAPPIESYKFDTSIGQIAGDFEVYQAVENTINESPRSFGEIVHIHQRSIPDLTQILGLLLHGGRIIFYQDDLEARTHSKCAQIHNTLTHLQLCGHPYSFRPVPAIRSCVKFDLPNAILEDALKNDSKADLVHSLNTALHNRGLEPKDTPENLVNKFHELKSYLKSRKAI